MNYNLDIIPNNFKEYYEHLNTMAAWYSGDLNRIIRLENKADTMFTVQANLRPDQKEEIVHIPIINDIARMNANLLFSEHCKFGFDAKSPAEKDKKWLESLIKENEIYSMLLESADVSSGLGAVYLKVNWNDKFSDYPIIESVQPDCAIPYFQYGRLVGVDFISELETDKDGKVWRLVETHQKGYIVSRLFCGYEDKIGREYELTYREDTQDILPIVNTDIEDLTAVYVPNIKPNTRFRGLKLGMADTSNLLSLMMSLDEAMTSLIRDISLARARIIAPELYFDRDANNRAYFDPFKQAYMSINSSLETGGINDNITLSQFAIRAEEHLSTVESLMKAIYSSAGYSPQSFGLGTDGSAETGVALRIKERMSFTTSAKKAECWRERLQKIIWVCMQIANKHLPVKPSIKNMPTVQVEDSITTDIRDIAQSVQYLSNAGALSVDTTVRLLHPDWTEDKINAEVEAIKTERGLLIPDIETFGRVNEE